MTYLSSCVLIVSSQRAGMDAVIQEEEERAQPLLLFDTMKTISI